MNTHRSFRSAMTWLHTWAGLLLGWVLFAIFVTGTAAYFRHEITAWMQPEIARSSTPVEAARHAFAKLQEAAPDSDRWLVSVPDERQRELTIHWKNPENPKARFEKQTLDPAGEGAPPRDTLGGEFFYRFHFQLMLPHPWGRYTACVAAMFMLVALVTGIFTHRRFFKDLFLLRLGRDGRRPWLDFHNVTAVLALPFYLMISYSALIIFTPMLIPLATDILAPAKPKPAAAAPANPGAENVSASAKPETTPAMWVTTEAFDAMLARVDDTWGAQRPLRRIEFSQRGTPKATVAFTRVEPTKISYVFPERDTLKFSALTGDLIEEANKPDIGTGTRIRGVFYGLHLAHFAGPVLRTLFFLMGIMGAAMVGTGLVLWTLKRRERLTQSGRGGRFGYRLVSSLNIATVAGLPVACAAFFWANRLIPADRVGRADLETNCFLIVWGVATLHAFVRPERQAWKEQLYVAALAFGALPIVDLLTAGRVLGAWPRADGIYLGFTVTMMLLGAWFAHGARKIARRRAALAAAKGDLA